MSESTPVTPVATSQESTASSVAPSTPAATEAQPSNLPRTFKVKVDGSEQEVDEGSLIKGYQLARASNKRFQEASAKEKQIQAQIEKMKSDPWSAMEEFGLNPREAAEAYLAAQLEEEMLSPQEKKLRDLERENQDYKKRDETAKEARERQHLEQLTAKHQESLQAEFIDAMTQAGMKPTYPTIRRMAALMHEAANNGIEMSASDAALIVSEELVGDVNEHLSAYSTAEDLVQLLGPERLKLLREYELKQLKNPTPKQIAHSEKQTESPKNQAKKYKSGDDFFAEARRKLGVK
jgi:hypothetical protein